MNKMSTPQKQGKPKAYWYRRLTPARSWSKKEENDMLDYVIQKNINESYSIPMIVEMCKKIKLDVKPLLVRNKMRNMKTLYYNALKWKREKIDQGTYSDEAMEDYISKRCPHFEKLDILCGHTDKAKKAAAPPGEYSENEDSQSFIDNIVLGGEALEDHENVTKFEDATQQNNELATCLKVEYDDYEENLDESWNQEVDYDDTKHEVPTDEDPDDPLDNPINTKNAIYPITNEDRELKRKYINLQRMKLEIERQKLSIVREKIAIRRQGNDEDAKYKALQLEQQERIRIHEINKETELKKYELSLKYR